MLHPLIGRFRALALVATVTVVAAACSSGSDGSYEIRDSNETIPSALEAAPTSGTTPPAVALAPSTSAARANVLHVATTGNDAAAGTTAAPMKTITAAVAKAKPGFTVLVDPGTYDESTSDKGVFISGANGTPDNWIVIRASGGSRPKIVSGDGDRFYIEKSSYLEVRGFEMPGNAATDLNQANGVMVSDSHHIRIVDNVVYGVGGGGIAFNYSNHAEVIGNTVWGTSAWSPYQTSGISTYRAANIGGGDDADGYSIRFVANTVYGVENRKAPSPGKKLTDGNCIIVDVSDQGGFTGHTLVSNNVCFDNGGRGVHVFGSSNTTVINNTLVNNAQSTAIDGNGELSVLEAKNVIFRNNLVITRAGVKEVARNGATSNIVIDHNIYVKPGATTHGDGDQVLADAGVRDAAVHDYRLLATSGAAGSGSADGAPTTDATGAARANPPSVGAYEPVG
jgi:parallel beta-helix repeat protein